MVNITSEVSDVYKKILQKGNYGRDHWESHGEAKTHG
jgi:hypothetical protein